jgi:opacity protein-like surface antigen
LKLNLKETGITGIMKTKFFIGFSLLLFITFFPSTSFAQEAFKGIRSRFSFGSGVKFGFGDQASAGVVGSIRFMGVAGADIEYDFNNVASKISTTTMNMRDLHFVPNLKLGGVVYWFRNKRYAPYGTGGLGLDLGSGNDRTNLYAGAGIEFTFLKDRITVNVGIRFFLPRPVDVEKHRERLIMEEKPSLPSYTEYYNFDTYQFTFAIRFYY